MYTGIILLRKTFTKGDKVNPKLKTTIYYLKRYGPAEVTAKTANYIGYVVPRELGLNEHVSAVVSQSAGTVAYFGTLYGQEFVTSIYRSIKNKKNIAKELAKDMGLIIAETGGPALLDTVIRTGMHQAATLVDSPWSMISASILTDLLFYVEAISINQAIRNKKVRNKIYRTTTQGLESIGSTYSYRI